MSVQSPPSTARTSIGPGKAARGPLNIRRWSGSARVWLGVLAYFVATGLAVHVAFPQALADPAQASFFQPSSLAIIWLFGLAGVWLAGRTGFPDALDPAIPARRRFLLPALLGVGFGLALVALDRASGFTAAIAAQHGVSRQYTGFLPTLLVFVAAAAIVEAVFRLLPLPLGIWIVSNGLLRGRGRAATFWILAVLVSLIEPATQFADTRILVPSVAGALLGLQFATNLVQAALFRRYGLLATLTLRVALYVVFHVLYIH